MCWFICFNSSTFQDICWNALTNACIRSTIPARVLSLRVSKSQMLPININVFRCLKISVVKLLWQILWKYPSFRPGPNDLIFCKIWVRMFQWAQAKWEGRLGCWNPKRWTCGRGVVREWISYHCISVIIEEPAVKLLYILRHSATRANITVVINNSRPWFKNRVIW